MMRYSYRQASKILYDEMARISERDEACMIEEVAASMVDMKRDGKENDAATKNTNGKKSGKGISRNSKGKGKK